MAARVPGRAEFLDVVRNSRAECARYGVDVKTGTEATAELLRAEAPDAVVLATGARPQRPYWAGESDRVVDVRDVLENTMRAQEVAVDGRSLSLPHWKGFAGYAEQQLRERGFTPIEPAPGSAVHSFLNPRALAGATAAISSAACLYCVHEYVRVPAPPGCLRAGASPYWRALSSRTWYRVRSDTPAI